VLVAVLGVTAAPRPAQAWISYSASRGMSYVLGGFGAVLTVGGAIGLGYSLDGADARVLRSASESAFAEAAQDERSLRAGSLVALLVGLPLCALLFVEWLKPAAPRGQALAPRPVRSDARVHLGGLGLVVRL